MFLFFSFISISFLTYLSVNESCFFATSLFLCIIVYLFAFNFELKLCKTKEDKIKICVDFVSNYFHALVFGMLLVFANNIFNNILIIIFSNLLTLIFEFIIKDYWIKEDMF